MVGICGIGGIGKTNIAKVVYNLIADQFEGSSYLGDVRTAANLVQLQERLLSEVLGEKEVEMGHADRGINVIRDRLCHKRVLLVLHDVNNFEQLKKLAGGCDWFGLGSRIIITTRDEHLLHAHRVKRIYRVRKLNKKDAIQLFSWNAFHKSYPTTGYKELSEEVINYANGLPLALIILGSFLCGKKLLEWKSALNKWKRMLKKDIFEILKISFDGLEDDEKNIFLDIACFFKGDNIDYVTKILNSCDFDTDIGIRVLIDKSLIFIDQWNKLEMHDLIQEMGREIVRQESPREPGRRSRLWFHEDVLQVLTENTGTNAIQGIKLHLNKAEKVDLARKVFKQMKSLRLLIMRTVDLFRGLEYLPNELRWVELPGYCFPCTFHPKKLAGLSMISSRIKSIKNFPNLKFMNFSWNRFLTEIPDFSSMIKLEELDLGGCKSLEKVHESVGFLDNLVTLNLDYCYNLSSFPSCLKMKSLKNLSLFDCRRLERFPDIVEEIEWLESIDLEGSGIKELPSSIDNFTGLKILNLNYCVNLEVVPSNIYKLRLRELTLQGCKRLERLPDIVEEMEWIKSIQLNRSGIKELPSSIEKLSGLRDLNLKDCENLQAIPDNIYKLQLLQNFYCSKVGFPTCVSIASPFSKLQRLSLIDCNLSQVDFLKNYGCLSTLEVLDLSGNNFVSLPTWFCSLRLDRLELRNCKQLREIPELDLWGLCAEGCISLEKYSLPSIRSNRITLFNCHKLVQSGSINWANILSRKDDLEMIFPGSNIPEWFGHQSTESCIYLELPSDAEGLAFCVVYELDDDTLTNKFYFRVKINGRFYPELTIVHSFRPILLSAHVCLKHFSRVANGKGRRSSFDFLRQVHGMNGRSSIDVLKPFECLFVISQGVIKRCGIHVVTRNHRIAENSRMSYAKRSWDEMHSNGYLQQKKYGAALDDELHSNGKSSDDEMCSNGEGSDDEIYCNSEGSDSDDEMHSNGEGSDDEW